MTGSLPSSFAVRVDRVGSQWRVALLALDASAALPELEQALGWAGGGGWPGPFVLVVDDRLYFVALRVGPDGKVRALVSDVTAQEWLLAAEAVERYGIRADMATLVGDDDSGWPGGDLDLFADAGLPPDELWAILSADDLWAEEMVAQIAERIGFAEELVAAVRE